MGHGDPKCLLDPYRGQNEIKKKFKRLTEVTKTSESNPFKSSKSLIWGLKDPKKII